MADKQRLLLGFPAAVLAGQLPHPLPDRAGKRFVNHHRLALFVVLLEGFKQSRTEQAMPALVALQLLRSLLVMAGVENHQGCSACRAAACQDWIPVDHFALEPGAFTVFLDFKW